MKYSKSVFFMLLVIFLSLVVGRSYSQIYPYIQWNKLYNAPSNLQDSSVSISRNSSGMVFVTGWSLGSSTLKDITTIRYNPVDGNAIWAKSFVTPGNDIVNYMVCDNNAVYITGWILTGGVRDIVTIKYNASTGDTMWVKKFNGPGNGGDYGFCVDVDNSGNVYVCGRSDVGGAQKYTVLKYSGAGALDTFIYRDPSLSTLFDEAHSIKVDNSGSFVYVTGMSGPAGSGNMLTLKLSTNPLALVWAKKHVGTGNADDNGVVVRLDNTQSSVFVGGTGRTVVPDFIVLKYNSNGDSIGYANYNGPTTGTDFLVGMAIDGSDNVYVTGSSLNAVANRYEFATVKYNSNLVQQWAARTPNNPDGWAQPCGIMALGTSNDLYVTGYTTKSGQGNNFLTIRYNTSNGDTVWTKQENGNTNGNDYACGVVYGDNQNIFLSGSAIFNPPGSTAFYTLRYSNEFIGIKPISSEIPVKFNVFQNYPNPFNPSTTIRFDIPKESFVKITVFDVMGREVNVIANESVKPGEYEAEWNAVKYASGIYFYRILAGDFSDTRKMILAK